ncbi:MAG TPA: hypothetical protein VFP37_15420 [Steroidobacteraceae bacterium]|nr:hypothetical protein [Steroidobacteraceae bacterium]
MALFVSTVVLLLIYGAIRSARSAKRKPSGAGAVGWAMLFLTFGRMPPPPPASQIEEANHGEDNQGDTPHGEDP